MKALGKVLIALVVLGGAVAAYRNREDRPVMPMVSLAPVTQGDVVQVVSATGTLAAARTVAVGSQVSGTVKKLFVDYNAIVKKGQVLAQIDPDKALTSLHMAEATLTEARSAFIADQAREDNDSKALSRMEALVKDAQETEEDRDLARVTVAEDAQKLQEDQANIDSANTGIDSAKLTIAQCTITSPIDGVVVTRDVDEGQTIVASIMSPNIFELANDLTAMEIDGATDEADVAGVKKGQVARFTVDSYPGQTFTGTVREVRLNATTINNVVTYQTVIDFKNPDLKLLPGMTAHFLIESGRSTGVLRVPVAALRFRPSDSAKLVYPGTVVPPAVRVTPTIAPGATAELWRVDGQRLVPVTVTLGRTDGTLAEVTAGAVKLSDEVITAIVTPKRR